MAGPGKAHGRPRTGLFVLACTNGTLVGTGAASERRERVVSVAPHMPEMEAEVTAVTRHRSLTRLEAAKPRTAPSRRAPFVHRQIVHRTECGLLFVFLPVVKNDMAGTGVHNLPLTMRATGSLAEQQALWLETDDHSEYMKILHQQFLLELRHPSSSSAAVRRAAQRILEVLIFVMIEAHGKHTNTTSHHSR